MKGEIVRSGSPLPSPATPALDAGPALRPLERDFAAIEAPLRWSGLSVPAERLAELEDDLHSVRLELEGLGTVARR